MSAGRCGGRSRRRSRRSTSISTATTTAAGSGRSRSSAPTGSAAGSTKPAIDVTPKRCYVPPRYIGRISDARGGAEHMAVAEPVAVRSQGEEAYARILERIVSLEMPPGSVVNEARLRDELGIGRTPIREALQRLARENLVRSVPHRGPFA